MPNTHPVLPDARPLAIAHHDRAVSQHGPVAGIEQPAAVQGGGFGSLGRCHRPNQHSSRCGKRKEATSEHGQSFLPLPDFVAPTMVAVICRTVGPPVPFGRSMTPPQRRSEGEMR